MKNEPHMSAGRRFQRTWFKPALVGFAAAVIAAVLAAPASAEDIPAGKLVSEVPANGTPHVLDGRVYSVVKVGNTMVLGGTFTSARNNSSTTAITRSRLLAFDATSGVISAAFVPNPNGAVNVVLPTGDGQTVYVGGSFSSIGGVSVSNLAKIRVSDGSVVTSFNAGTISGQVKDLRLADGQLWVAGGFTHVRGAAQKALATLNPTTGARTNFFQGVIAGVHNGGYTTVTKIDSNAQEDSLVAVGNFDTLDGQKNRQLFVLDTSGSAATPSTLRTKFYETPCSSSFDSYMRDVDIAPDGTYFVVSTTGAYGGSTTACDTTARFELASSGDDIRPSWINSTGGDTTYGVEVRDRVVYVGGHQRWQNNPFAGDRPGPGAMDRPGVAALDPVNGLPYSWNPTRSRGVGLFDFLETPQGLWAVSDTERFGKASLYRGRVAMLPSAGGTDIESMKDQHLPNDVYLAGVSGAASDPSVLYRVNAGGPEIAATTGIDWSPNTAGNPSPYVNAGNNIASYEAIPSVDASVPASTPLSIFNNELWDGAGGQEMQWSFPVPSGTEVKVRLYFANRYSGTSSVGQRVFNVDIDGGRLLSNYDIVADVGHERGVMKSFDVTSDGQIDISLGHVVENPLINGIEILLKDATPAAGEKVLKRTFDGTTPGIAVPAPQGSVNWDAVRGAFMLNGRVYLAQSDGNFVRRTFNGTTWGDAQAVNAQDELVVLQAWRSDISAMTGMFFDYGRIYFTLSGSDQLYYRYFNPESRVVGAIRYVASGSVDGLNYSTVRGMFLADGKLYWRTSNGDLRRADWASGSASGRVVGGTAALVSGPSNGGPTWDARAPFVFQDEDGLGAPLPPTASFEVDCTSLTCSFDAGGSSSPGTTITAYAWTFSDGTSATGRTATKTFAQNGSYTATLQITTAKGGTSQTSQTLSVERQNQGPTAAFSAECGVLSCTFDSSASSDDEGIVSRVWNFGDGTPTGTGPAPTHAYVEAGTYTVTLTVTDSDEETDEAVRTIQVQAEPSSDVDYVAAVSTNGNRTTHPITVPSTVQGGDRLLMFMTANGDTTATVPSGWTLIRTAQRNGTIGWAWTKVAAAQDAGSSLSVTLGRQLKGGLTITAYRAESGTPSISQSAIATAQATSSVPAPAIAASSGDWIVNYWGLKSSSALTLSAPDVESRSTSVGSGSGGVYSWLGDSGGPVPAGQAGPFAAETSVAASRAVMISIGLGQP